MSLLVPQRIHFDNLYRNRVSARSSNDVRAEMRVQDGACLWIPCHAGDST